MITVDYFRRIALSLPGSVESSHMEHPDFRVNNRIFATIWPNESWGMVKLTSHQQRTFLKAHSGVFIPVTGGWGRQGCTNVRLDRAGESIVRKALETAWSNRASKGSPGGVKTGRRLKKGETRAKVRGKSR